MTDTMLISILVVLLVATFISFIRSLNQVEKVYIGEKYRTIDDDFFTLEIEKTSKITKSSMLIKLLQNITGVFVLKKVIHVLGIHLEDIARDISMAKLDDKYTCIQVATMKVIGIVGTAMFGIVGLTFTNEQYLLIGFIIFLYFYVLPTNKIKETLKKRRKAIEYELPAFVERVHMCLVGGAQIFEAITFVAESTPGVLSEEIVSAIQEQAYDLNFLEGTLQRKAEELNIPEFSSFISNIMIGKTKGVPIAGILEDEVEKMHKLMFAQFDEIAGRVEAKATTYQIIGGMLPTLLLALLPAVITFMESM